jgi:L-aminopeptidase/D-esterase-like protein
MRVRHTVPAVDLAIDLPGLSIGVAEDADGTTGCTVLVFDEPVAMITDVRGGRPAVVGGEHGGTTAICLAGGSLLGLEATSGVLTELWEQMGRPTGFGQIRAAAGAVIFDWRRRTTYTYPDHDMGRRAVRAARASIFPCGRRGAGCSATYNKLRPDDVVYRGGQGAAFDTYANSDHAIHVAAFTVVNAVGMVTDRAGKPVIGAVAPPPRDDGAPIEEGNSTVTVIATDAVLNTFELRQWSRQVHTSMARAIHPFHTTRDGDVLFAVTTGRSQQRVDVDLFGVHTSELLWDAVMAAVTK